LGAPGREVGRDRVQRGVRPRRQAALEALLELIAVEPPGEVVLSQDLGNELAV
jgi:hypothetical protein